MEPLQELFENELRNYQFYSRKIKELREEIQILENKQDELERRQKVEDKTNGAANLLSTLKKDGLSIPDESFEEVMQSLLDYKFLDGEKEELERINKRIIVLEDILTKFRTRKRICQKDLFDYIELASERQMQFVFEKDNSMARKIFALMYQDDFNFARYRNVIQLEGCKLSKRFLKAYTADTREEKIKALEWFKKQAEAIQLKEK